VVPLLAGSVSNASTIASRRSAASHTYASRAARSASASAPTIGHVDRCIPVAGRLATDVRSSDTDRLETDTTTVTAGDALYDVAYGRVLWVSRIDPSGVTVESATTYDVAEAIGWSPGDRSGVVTTGTTFDPAEFVDLVDTGRFDVAR
jgi:hypothetical protein